MFGHNSMLLASTSCFLQNLTFTRNRPRAEVAKLVATLAIYEPELDSMYPGIDSVMHGN